MNVGSSIYSVEMHTTPLQCLIWMSKANWGTVLRTSFKTWELNATIQSCIFSWGSNTQRNWTREHNSTFSFKFIGLQNWYVGDHIILFRFTFSMQGFKYTTNSNFVLQIWLLMQLFMFSHSSPNSNDWNAHISAQTSPCKAQHWMDSFWNPAASNLTLVGLCGVSISSSSLEELLQHE